MNTVTPGLVSKRVSGVALMLVGSALLGYGVHNLVRTGNCSSTGYVSFGPVPRCPSTEPLSILSVFFVGPALVVIGRLLAPIRGSLRVTTTVSLGIGLIMIHSDGSAPSDARTFGLIAGLCMFCLTLVAAAFLLRKRSSSSVTPPDGAGPGTRSTEDAAPPRSVPSPAVKAEPRAPTEAGLVDEIARLARLRDTGALTPEQFTRATDALIERLRPSDRPNA